MPSMLRIDGIDGTDGLDFDTEAVFLFSVKHINNPSKAQAIT